MTQPIKVTTSDPSTGEVLDEATIENGYILICAGNRYLAGTNAFPATGTHVLTIKRQDSPAA